MVCTVWLGSRLIDIITNYEIEKDVVLNENNNIYFDRQTFIAEREKFWRYLNDKRQKFSAKFLLNQIELAKNNQSSVWQAKSPVSVGSKVWVRQSFSSSVVQFLKLIRS